MSTFIYAVLAALAGVCIAMQAPANTRLRTNLNDPFLAAFGSICGTFLTAVGMIFCYWLIVRPDIPTWETVRSTQWWNWIGGPLGTLFVLAGATLTRELGAAAFIALVIGGQLLCSLLVDHFAMMGFQQQPLTLGRATGALLVVVGVVCIKYL